MNPSTYISTIPNQANQFQTLQSEAVYRINDTEEAPLPDTIQTIDVPTRVETMEPQAMKIQNKKRPDNVFGGFQAPKDHSRYEEQENKEEEDLVQPLKSLSDDANDTWVHSS